MSTNNWHRIADSLDQAVVLLEAFVNKKQSPVDRSDVYKALDTFCRRHRLELSHERTQDLKRWWTTRRTYADAVVTGPGYQFMIMFSDRKPRNDTQIRLAKTLANDNDVLIALKVEDILEPKRWVFLADYIETWRTYNERSKV